MYGELKIKDVPKTGFGNPLPRFVRQEPSFYVVRGEQHLTERLVRSARQNRLNVLFFWRPANRRYPRGDELARMYGVFVFVKKAETKIKYSYMEEDIPLDMAIEFMGRHIKLWLVYINSNHHPGMQGIVTYADRVSDMTRDADNYIPVREGMIENGICRFEFKDLKRITAMLDSTSIRRI